MAKLLFITGTDTGVGKTVVTSSLLRCLRRGGAHGLAVKPFCSGDRDDVRRLCCAQDNELSQDECNPYYFSAPLAPAAAIKNKRKTILLDEVVRHVERVGRRCEVLLVEGVGGIMVPLGNDFTVLDFIRALKCPRVLIVSANRLGTLNHTLLTNRVVRAEFPGLESLEVILNQTRLKADESCHSNLSLLKRWMPETEITRLPYLGRKPFGNCAFAGVEKKMKKVLARIFDSAIFAARQTRRVKKLQNPLTQMRPSH